VFTILFLEAIVKTRGHPKPDCRFESLKGPIAKSMVDFGVCPSDALSLQLGYNKAKQSEGRATPAILDSQRTRAYNGPLERNIRILETLSSCHT
jgi:hypothetical protein